MMSDDLSLVAREERLPLLSLRFFPSSTHHPRSPSCHSLTIIHASAPRPPLPPQYRPRRHPGLRTTTAPAAAATPRCTCSWGVYKRQVCLLATCRRAARSSAAEGDGTAARGWRRIISVQWTPMADVPPAAVFTATTTAFTAVAAAAV